MTATALRKSSSEYNKPYFWLLLMNLEIISVKSF